MTALHTQAVLMLARTAGYRPKRHWVPACAGTTGLACGCSSSPTDHGVGGMLGAAGSAGLLRPVKLAVIPAKAGIQRRGTHGQTPFVLSLSKHERAPALGQRGGPDACWHV